MNCSLSNVGATRMPRKSDPGVGFSHSPWPGLWLLTLDICNKSSVFKESLDTQLSRAALPRTVEGRKSFESNIELTEVRKIILSFLRYLPRGLALGESQWTRG
jgi:hypothetical protein